MSPKIIKVDTKKALEASLNLAVSVISTGGVVAFPTESFYGLGVNARNEKAVKHLFAIKKRRTDQPVLILIPARDMLDRCVTRVPKTAQKLMEQFWPGGLTLVFEAGPDIPRSLTGGTGRIGVRLSSHPIATGLSQKAGLPITGTSANVSGEPAPTTAEQVVDSLRDTVDLILDGGETQGGKGSTLLDVTVDPPRILREGMVGREDLEKFVSLSKGTKD
jgi:L-threonylcarbamoyladenylate synthase